MITQEEFNQLFDDYFNDPSKIYSFKTITKKEANLHVKLNRNKNLSRCDEDDNTYKVAGTVGSGSYTKKRLYEYATGRSKNKKKGKDQDSYVYAILDALGVHYPPLGYPEDKNLTYTDAINISSNRKRKDEQRITQYVQDLEIGQVGEAIALKIVHEKWDKKHYTIKDVSEEKSPSGIYDIQVKEKKTGKIIAAIEVKSTTGRRDTDFFLTENEKKAWEHYKEKYFIYRIYELQLTSKPTYKYHVIDNEQLRAAYHLSVKDYTVSRLENKQK